MLSETEVLIVGTGAMACLFAARLAAAGQPVTMLGHWRSGLRALQKHGVHLELSDGSQAVYPVKATSDPRRCTGACYALVLVKSWQTQKAAVDLQRCLAPEGLALTLQNGLGNAEILRQCLGAGRLALGVSTSGATLLGPGRVRPAGDGPLTIQNHAAVEPLAEILAGAGFAVEFVQDAQALLWGKLLINAAINALTALLGVPNGVLLQRPSAGSLMAEAAVEAAAVAAALGVALPYPDPFEAARVVAQRTAENRSSMLQDVQRGAPTEVDAINGAIVRLGKQTGTPTPVNRALWLLVRALVQEAENAEGR
jgi:2-dehydropantoate 2-reductase